MDNGIGGADVAQKLVAQALALGRTLHQARNVHKFNDGGGEFLGLVLVAQPFQPCIGNGDHANIGVDGTERVIGRLGAGVGDGVKQGGFSHVGQSYDT